MIFLYTSLVWSLVVVKWLVGRKVRSLEKRYERVAHDADHLVHEASFRPGNSSKPDPAQAAKQQFLLGQLVQKRDRLEARHDAAMRRAEWFGKAVTAVRQWKGRKLPYLFGAVDFYTVMALVDRFGLGQYTNYQTVTDWVGSFWAH
jgi:hypothetical protein